MPLERSSGWDVVVVGAGPAGLSAALTVAHLGSSRVLVIDQGAGFDDRVAAGRREGNYLEGFGGAGLFSDGKLCMSLDVGGHLETTLSSTEKERLLGVVKSFVSSVLPAPWAGVPARVTESVQRSATVGLALRYYPVVHIGTDRCVDVLAALRAKIDALGIEMASGARLIDVRREPGGFSLVVEQVSSQKTVRAGSLVLAVGKVGAAFQRSWLHRLDIALEPSKLYVGVRVETASFVLAPLFAMTKDPKLSLVFDDGTKIKTHCASQGGQILRLLYDGLPLAGGHNYRQRVNERSGFAVLWDGSTIGEGQDPYSFARQIMQQVASDSGGALVAEMLPDLLSGVASPREPTCRCSTDEFVVGDLRRYLPAAFFPKFTEFVSRIERLTPGLVSDETMVFAPAIEWWMERVQTAPDMRTTAPGLFVCGDGGGWTQGIVQAAATGILAGESIAQRRLDPAHLCRIVSPSPA